MNIEQYISSGKLESYAMGMLSVEEGKEVIAMAEAHPEIRAELNKIEAALEQFAQANAIETPDGMEAKIVEQIRQKQGDEQASTDTKNKTAGGKWYLFFLILSLLFSALVSWYYSSRLNKVSNELDELNQEYVQLQEDCNSIKEENDRNAQQIAYLKNPATLDYSMPGTPLAPQSLAVVHWNAADNKAFLNIVNLAPPPTGKQYQLWAIVDGQPVDMGVFTIDPAADFVEVPFIAEPQAFAVTIEPEGGSSAPTLDQMVMIGETS